jgi:hypothetical protein
MMILESIYDMISIIMIGDQDKCIEFENKFLFMLFFLNYKRPI